MFQVFATGSTGRILANVQLNDWAVDYVNTASDGAYKINKNLTH
jgi:hypothetical protein